MKTQEEIEEFYIDFVACNDFRCDGCEKIIKKNRHLLQSHEKQLCFRCFQKEQAEINQKRKLCEGHVTRKRPAPSFLTEITRSYKKSRSPGIPGLKELLFLKKLF